MVRMMKKYWVEIRHSDNEKPIVDKSNLMDYGIFIFKIDKNSKQKAKRKQKTTYLYLMKC